ncbi:hypothetical protein CR47_0212170 [Ralstonia solanacearum]|nr:hypothetical protein CCY86_12065 [Ralstonia solanacearum]KFZ93902.2 hypothetical protein CR47_0212170 [Ralstonia solanacearum]OCQ57629.1 hypothetical protein AR463_01090 [Ralstonia solanacearum]OCQ74299.1 hypothetical protein AR466_14840 [Ralstonia solanacearum]PNQ37774.1 hypothetical protein CVV71_07500 [Ralstonia solanacearum]
MEKHSKEGNIGKVMDLVDEHGNTFDKMAFACVDGNLGRVIELENLGVNCTDRGFIKAAVKHNQEVIVLHQVKQGASLDEVIEVAKIYENNHILNLAKSRKRDQMGKRK